MWFKRILDWIAPHGIGIRGILVIAILGAIIAALFVSVSKGQTDFANTILAALIAWGGIAINALFRSREDRDRNGNGGKA